MFSIRQSRKKYSRTPNTGFQGCLHLDRNSLLLEVLTPKSILQKTARLVNLRITASIARRAILPASTRSSGKWLSQPMGVFGLSK